MQYTRALTPALSHQMEEGPEFGHLEDCLSV